MKSLYKNKYMMSVEINGVTFSLHISNLSNRNFSSGAKWDTKLHSHMYYELFYCEKGSAEILFSDGVAEIGEGDCIIVEKNVVHTLRYVNTEKSLYNIVIDITGNKSRVAEYEEILDTLCNGRYAMIKKNFDIGEIMKAMCQYFYMDFEDRKHLVGARFYELIYTLKKLSQHRTKVIDDLSLDSSSRDYLIDVFLATSFDTPGISIDMLSERLYLSSSQTARIVKEKTGKTFKQIILSLRMENATRLLRTTDISVNDIASMVGYVSNHGFYVAFKKTYSITPEQYRKENRNK